MAKTPRSPRTSDSLVSGNLLYYGDTLAILGRYIKDESIDLIYLDPPFNSDQDYNVLFKERDGTRAASQIRAFNDTWRWDEASASTYWEFVQKNPGSASQALQGLRTATGEN